jgi:hypothetical protein
LLAQAYGDRLAGNYRASGPIATAPCFGQKHQKLPMPDCRRQLLDQQTSFLVLFGGCLQPGPGGKFRPHRGADRAL